MVLSARSPNRSPRANAYEKGLREVLWIAGTEATGELADWIQEEIRTGESYPSARGVGKRGARICRDRANELSTGSWLGA